jgi:hypothetical protein
MKIEYNPTIFGFIHWVKLSWGGGDAEVLDQ